MKKTTKLLSVILAFVMALSCMTMMASAAKTSYQTVANLESLQAYSPYGTVTRLSTEERMSILMDSLDLLLQKANINLGTVLDTLGLKVTLDFRSVNALLGSLDTIYTTKNATMYMIAAAVVNLGIVEDLDVSTWAKGMTREGTAQMTIVNEILELLSKNASVVEGVLTNGIQLGLIANFINGLDLDPINNLVKDLPKLINGIVLPLFSRPDDNAAQRNTLGNTGSNLMTVAQSFVNGIFNKPMSWTSYRVDAQGNDLGFTTTLPIGAPSGTSRYFVAGTNEQGKATLTQYDYKFAPILGGDEAGYEKTVTYTLSDTEEYTGSGTYLYKAPDDYEGDHTLKWYKAENKVDNNGNVQSGYWLPSVAGKVGTDITLNINGNDSVAGLLYKWAPVVFAELAPTVANGSLKKVIAGAFDVTFTKVGLKGDDAVAALAAATGNPENFFTKAQPYYTWEYSDYMVIDGTPYYRFQDEYFVGEIPSNISLFYNMINWNYKISDNFINKYIPATVGGTSQAGYTRILEGINDFVYDLIQEFIAPSWQCKGKTVNRDDVFVWTAGDNSHLINNVVASARNLFMLAPEEIVDEYYADAQFYDAMMNGSNEKAAKGLICAAVNLLMPQIKFADNIVDQPMLAIAAAVVRELCTQLMPTYDFDAMIFAQNTYSSNDRQMLAGKSSEYWLDTTLYMGINLGMYYLRNIADIGEDDSTNGYYGAMKNMGALPGDTGDAMTFTATSQYVDGTTNPTSASWLRMVDWVIDWALSSEVEWAWHFGRILGEGDNANQPMKTNKIELKSYQNPFNKLDNILLTLLPLDQLLNATGLAGTTYGSGSFVEKILKDGLVDSITTLDVPKLIGLLAVPDGYFTSNNIADQLVKIIVNLLNKILFRAAGNTNIISGITSVSTLLNHNNLKAVVKNLVSKLYGASNTYKVLDPILPIANFFIGWTTDPQKYAEPDIIKNFGDGDTYALNTATNNITFINNSSGMLLKHRNSSTVDTAYTIKIKSIASEGNVITTNLPAAGKDVAPGGQTDIKLTTPASRGVNKLTITYQYTGKNGAALGGDQTKVVYVYYTTVKDQQDEWEDAVDTGDYATREAYRKIEFTQNLFGSITEYTGTMSYKGATVQIGNKTKNFVSCGVLDTAFDTRATQFFKPITDRATAGWLTKLEKNNNDYASSVGKLYQVKSTTTTAATFNEANSEANNYYGVWNMGQVATKYGNKSGTWHVQFVYYNDYKIGDVYNEYVGKGLKSTDFSGSAAAAFNTYEAALKDIVKWNDYEKTTSYVTDVQANIKTAITALETAYETLVTFGVVQHNGNVAKVKATLDSLETNPDRDINFQDYALFEYFKYENERTSARNMIKATKGPDAPQKYIENGAWGTDLVEAIVASKNGTATQTGILATVVEPTADELADYEIALNDFIPASYSELAVEDQDAKLNYYYSFMQAQAKDVDKTFLAKEIAYVNAMNFTNPDGEVYSTDSWSRLVDAKANADAVYADANALESEVFDAKYELMCAANGLLLKSHSMKDSSYLNEEIIPLINHAQAILANYTLYELADDATVSEEEALGMLVRALGIDYAVELDGKTIEGILYDRSARTFEEYDRVNSVKNMRATDAAADKLREAIQNFSCKVTVEPDETVDQVIEIEQKIRYIQGIVPGSITTEVELDAKITVKVKGGAATVKHEIIASKADQYGTGARVEVKTATGDVLLATYFVIIYGDVNGDGAVDAMDAIEVDLANNRLNYMGDVYDDAADVNCDGIVDADDYGAIVDCVKCAADIDQNPTAVVA